MVNDGAAPDPNPCTSGNCPRTCSKSCEFSKRSEISDCCSASTCCPRFPGRRPHRCHPSQAQVQDYMLHRDGKTILIIIRSSSPIIFTEQGAVIHECTRHGFQGIVVPMLSTYSLGALFAIRSTLILRYLRLLFLPGLDKLYV